MSISSKRALHPQRPPGAEHRVALRMGQGDLDRSSTIPLYRPLAHRMDRPAQLSSLYGDLTRADQHPKTRVLINEVIAGTDEVCARLRLSRRHPVLHLRRVRLVDEEPLAILENFLPDDLGVTAGGIGGEIGGAIRAADLSTIGLYQAMRGAGVRMCIAKQRIAAREGTPEECLLLDEPAGSPLLTVERLTHDDSGRVVEWGRHAYRPDRYAFTVTLVGH